ncbi:BsuPI-related putative proteinase inhibitor [Natrinema sp. 1APR25-10V2]|uniref:BsuPI-related putative proteinase inhibitor n=1 Tax=Natrinema sp. 1APR25-10V2 TaxID=2951081 RepID=UPI00287541F3|nr:BsuPI-related putative proteinase inhibitor [Natrinema sp. 1APR25-10V2]MDS0474312.1 BsuPI-related putative proteinase inhibitor [Natrinema sp. 1APR25-10V2]
MTLDGSLETAGDDARDAVLFVFTVTNAGSEPVELRFSDACKAEFVVIDSDEEVWRFSEGRMFAQVLESETIAPGESTTYEAEWSDPEPGTYEAVADLRAQDETCEAQTALSIQS